LYEDTIIFFTGAGVILLWLLFWWAVAGWTVHRIDRDYVWLRKSSLIYLVAMPTWAEM
jgi:hypothetical protein